MSQSYALTSAHHYSRLNIIFRTKTQIYNQFIQTNSNRKDISNEFLRDFYVSYRKVIYGRH